MKLIKKNKREFDYHLIVFHEDSEFEIICNFSKKIISVGFKDDLMVSPEDLDLNTLEKLQEFCHQNIKE